MLAAVLQWKEAGHRLADFKPGATGARVAGFPDTSLEAELGALLGPGVVLIDCTATNGTTPLLKQCLSAGGAVVLANKKVPRTNRPSFERPVASMRCSGAVSQSGR